MKKIVPKFLLDENGNKTGALFKKSDFEKIMEALEDYHDYKLVKERTAKPHKTYTFKEILTELNEKR